MMRQRVKCANCDTIWDRVTTMGSDVEFTEDLCYTCPKCGSNAYEVLPVDKDKKEGE